MEISIVVPTYNRKNSIRRCIESLLVQDYPRDRFEIVVIDDGSNDSAIQLLDKISKSHPNIRYFTQHHKGPAAARNLGALKAQGEIIGFTDDDCTLDKDWARLMVETHRNNPGISVIGGYTIVPSAQTSVQVSQFLSTGAIKTWVNGREEVIFFPTCNVSIKGQIFENYRFDEKFPLPGGEDLEFFWRLFKDGHRFIWDKSINVIHYREGTIESFIKQAYIYGRGNLLTQYIHRDQPLLHELKVGNYSFWLATLVNFIKIPRFSHLLGNRIIHTYGIKNRLKKLAAYTYFALHKIFYLVGNIAEFLRIRMGNLHTAHEDPPSIPRLLILDIAHSCNLECRICDIWKTKKTEQDINLEHVKKMLYEAKELGIKEIALSGGEPLLRDDIFNILAYAQGIGIKNLGLLTNGILVSRFIEQLKPYLMNNTISLIVSLDSVKPSIHNHVRNSDVAWENTMESLRHLSALKKECPKINFNVISIILNQNLEELSELAQFIKSLGANSLQFQPLLANNLRMSERKGSDFWVSEERLRLLDSAVDRLVEFKKENPRFVRNSIENISLVKKYYRGTIAPGEVKCSSAYTTVLTSNQGTCTTCFSCYGDVKRQGLREILQDHKREQAHKEVQACVWPCLLPCFCDM